MTASAVTADADADEIMIPNTTETAVTMTEAEIHPAAAEEAQTKTESPAKDVLPAEETEDLMIGHPDNADVRENETNMKATNANHARTTIVCPGSR